MTYLSDEKMIFRNVAYLILINYCLQFSQTNHNNYITNMAVRHLLNLNILKLTFLPE